MVMVKGGDQPGLGGAPVRFEGDLTVASDGRLVWMTPDERVLDLGDLLAALVGEGPDAMGDRHVGRVRLTLEVLDRHVGLASGGSAPRTRGRR